MNKLKVLTGTVPMSLILIIFCVFYLVSCIPVICSNRASMYIVNNTKDTILIGTAEYAEYNIIDSVKFFLPGDWNSDEWTEFDGYDYLIIGNLNLIIPASAGCYNSTAVSYGPRLGSKNGEKAYFFIIKLNTAKNYSWKEICRDKLYDTLVVTREMLGPGNIIEYTGPQDNHVIQENSP